MHQWCLVLLKSYEKRQLKSQMPWDSYAKLIVHQKQLAETLTHAALVKTSLT